VYVFKENNKKNTQTRTIMNLKLAAIIILFVLQMANTILIILLATNHIGKADSSVISAQSLTEMVQFNTTEFATLTEGVSTNRALIQQVIEDEVQKRATMMNLTDHVLKNRAKLQIHENVTTSMGKLVVQNKKNVNALTTKVQQQYHREREASAIYEDSDLDSIACLEDVNGTYNFEPSSTGDDDVDDAEGNLSH
jgi:hypothetical protein